jgi:hypothetical protein
MDDSVTINTLSVTASAPSDRYVKACEACGEPVEAERSSKRFCGVACRMRAHRSRTKPRSYQRRIALREMAASGRPKMASLDGCEVRRVETQEVRDLIVRYEWLGTIGRANAAYALVAPNGGLLGAVLFGLPGNPKSGDICGIENCHLAICLERGCCTPWAPKNAPFFSDPARRQDGQPRFRLADLLRLRRPKRGRAG